MSDLYKKIILLSCFFISLPVIADSAAAWEAYQKGRNPLLELLFLVIGVVIFFTLLVSLHKFMESTKKNKRKNKQSK